MNIAGTAYEMRNRRSVWEVATQPFSEAHFATFPPALIEPCILAGCPKGGTVLDPFGGAGTTGLVADRLGRSAILIELNPAYAEMAERRLKDDAGMFAEISRDHPDDYDAQRTSRAHSRKPTGRYGSGKQPAAQDGSQNREGHRTASVTVGSGNTTISQHTQNGMRSRR